MKITTARRISQVFFVVLLVWLCVVSSVGTDWYRLRGWPVNILLQLDPLVAIATLITTGTIFAGLIWSIATIIGTILLGRFFCGWVCPFGSIHHFFGWLGRRKLTAAGKIKANTYRRGQGLKYYILIAMLAMAAGAWIAGKGMAAGTILTGLLDPIPLVYRSVNLVLLPVADSFGNVLSSSVRHYEWAWLIGIVFGSAVMLNFVIPRFYCRFICPLGALLGIFSRFAIFRFGKNHKRCTDCQLCTTDCEGACSPAGKIRISECVLCGNCLHTCGEGTMTYSTSVSAAGEKAGPDISRRGVILSLVSGLAASSLARLAAGTGANWNSGLIRPPGALAEEKFLARCIKCGQCMRVCPTNVIQPAGAAGGLETLWTPTLNNRIGTSGCQFNCVACSQICPTAALRPLTLDEKMGLGDFAETGPIRMGTAFVDRGRCLPWAMGRPCIVCQENCPVSPKAIYLSEVFETVRYGELTVASADEFTIDVTEILTPGAFATGDYYCRLAGANKLASIVANGANSITLSDASEIDSPAEPGQQLEVQVKLSRPVVDPAMCIGCGVCEHECPVSGTRAIRVTAENESRSADHSLLS